jgi:hypothetical protein
MRTPHRAFDPVSPLPSTTLANLMATGAGQAARPRMQRCAVYGALASLAVAVVAPSLWVAGMPFLAAAAFAAYGLATRRLLVLQALHRRAPLQRALLGGARWGAIVLGAVAALAGLGGIVLALMAPRPPGW